MGTRIVHMFETNKVEMTDGSITWEVVHGEEELRIATFDNEGDADELEMTLNLAITDAKEKKGAAINCLFQD